jgi:hypothetical protein
MPSAYVAPLTLGAHPHAAGATGSIPVPPIKNQYLSATPNLKYQNSNKPHQPLLMLSLSIKMLDREDTVQAPTH